MTVIFMLNLKKNSALFTMGGLAYSMIEVLWRGKTHWSMLITGGACFVSLFRIFDKLTDISLWRKCLIGSGIITVYEFCSGCIFNLWLKLKVWDYSNIPFNIKGQICPLYSFLWGLLCIPVNFICKQLK